MATLQPIIKWAGGKALELPIIESCIPNNINNYVEPFLGGGAVFFSMRDCQIKGRCFVNDFSSELMSLYGFVARNDTAFFDEMHNLSEYWDKLKRISETYSHTFLRHITDRSVEIAPPPAELYDEMVGCCHTDRDTFIGIYYDSIESKVRMAQKLMKRAEAGEGNVGTVNTGSLYETALKMTLYTHVRRLYNIACSNEKQLTPEMSALFAFIREYCYSSMFRYNRCGEFNVPYGGISYNSKSFALKEERMRNPELQRHLREAELCNSDFEQFLNKIEIGEDDFLFVDPPYDSEFCDYANNAFDRHDQIRLADALMNCPGRVMVVIKQTNFIYDIYASRGFNMFSFDKCYSVNFKNRNAKAVKHLLITNYSLPETARVGIAKRNEG